MFCSHYDMLEKSLVKRGFIVHQAKDVNEAKQLAFSLIKPNESVGFGGSVTVQNDLDLYNELQKTGNHKNTNTNNQPQPYPKYQKHT